LRVAKSILLSLSVLAGALPIRAGEGPEAAAGDPLAWAQENLNAGRYRDAADQLRKALASAKEGSGEWAGISLQLARVLRIVGEYEDGVKLCDGVLAREAGNTAAGCLRGELLAEVGRYEEALNLYDALIQAHPQFQRAWALRKRVAAVLGKKDVVKDATDHFFELFNSNAERYHKGDVEDAMEPAYVGIGIQDENPKDAFEVGFMLAEGLLEKRGQREPEALVWSAQLAFEKYAFDFAAKRFQAALKMRPKLPDALTGLAQVLITVRHDLKTAEPMLREALQINPRHIEARLTLAMLHIQDDEMEDARKHIDAALAVNPNHLDALAMLAFYHRDLKQKDLEQAVERRVFGINPTHADYYCSVGQLMESKRVFHDAASYYRKAIALDPTYWRGYYALGMNTSRQGAHGEEEGKQLLLKAFEMNRFNLWASNMVKALDKIIGDGQQQVAPVYAASQTDNFTVKFHTKESALIRPYLEEWAEGARASQVKLFGFEPQGPLTIEVLFSFQDQAARTVGVPNLGALGVCFGKLCTLVSPREGRGGHPPFNWRRVLEHEFAHVMALQLSDFRVPRWYTEGISVYIEDDSRLNTDQMMVNALAKGQLKPIEKINEYFKGNMLMAYVHGRFIIEYIDKTFGFEAHNKALRLFAQGRKVESVLPEVTGKTMAELNAAQLEYVRNFYSRVRLLPSYDQVEMAKLESAASAPDAPAQSLAELARAYLRQRGGMPRAEALAQKALDKDPQCADAHTVLGQVSFSRKDFSLAKGFFEKATQLAPDRSFSSWQQLGVIYKKEGRTSKAIAALEQARRLYPRYEGENNPHYLLPDLYLDLDPPQTDKALGVWRDALRANTSDAQAAKEGLKLALKLKDHAAALQFAQAVFEVDPYDPDTHRKAAGLFEEAKDLARAAREYAATTSLDEKDVESWVGLGRVELARGNRDAAAKAVEAALEIDATYEKARELRKQLGL
jgi:tetratricopeptide (TPR) repeat protein